MAMFASSVLCCYFSNDSPVDRCCERMERKIVVKSVHILGEYVTELVLDSYNSAHDGENWGIISLLYIDIITDVQGL